MVLGNTTRILLISCFNHFLQVTMIAVLLFIPDVMSMCSWLSHSGYLILSLQFSLHSRCQCFQLRAYTRLDRHIIMYWTAFRGVTDLTMQGNSPPFIELKIHEENSLRL